MQVGGVLIAIGVRRTYRVRVPVTDLVDSCQEFQELFLLQGRNSGAQTRVVTLEQRPILVHYCLEVNQVNILVEVIPLWISLPRLRAALPDRKRNTLHPPSLALIAKVLLKLLTDVQVQLYLEAVKHGYGRFLVIPRPGTAGASRLMKRQQQRSCEPSDCLTKVDAGGVTACPG